MLYECPSDLIIICELEIFLGTKQIILLLIIIFSIVLMENILFSCDFSLTLVILKYVFNLQLGKVQKSVNIAGLRLLSLERPACEVGLGWHLGTWISGGFPPFCNW